jgi:hypothetical protein
MKPTPHLDAWIIDLEKFLRAEPGRIAALGRHLFGDTKLAQVKVSEWLARKNNPNGEHVLAISAWLKKQQRRRSVR